MLKYLLATVTIFAAAAALAEPPMFVSIDGPDSLGYGAPITKAPVPDSLRRTASKVFDDAVLVSLRSDPNEMLALNGYASTNARIVQSSAGVPRYVAPIDAAVMGCSGAGCSGSVMQSYGSCSGSGCSGAQSRGLFRNRERAILPWRRR